MMTLFQQLLQCTVEMKDDVSLNSHWENGVLCELCESNTGNISDFMDSDFLIDSSSHQIRVPINYLR